MLLLLAAAAAAAQYKWVEADGSVGYGDEPPANARKVERISAGSGAAPGADGLAGLPFEVRRAARDFPVTLYASVGSECLPCNTARSFLRSHSIPYAERTVSTAKDLASYQALAGTTQVPALSVGRAWLRGFEEHAWLDALDGAGYPRNAVLPRGWSWPAPVPLTPPEAPPPAPAPAPESEGGGY
jgi:glutaredoxin